MRRLDTTFTYSKRAYFFGIIAFICFLIKSGLISVQRLTATIIPNTLLWAITILYLLTGLFAVFYSIKGVKEPNSFKKLIGLAIAVLFILQLIRSLSIDSIT